MAWIVNSMEEEIKEYYLYFSTSKGLWDALTVAFSDLDNSSQFFELRNQVCNLQQDLDDTQYYSALQKLWKEIDMFVIIDWENPGDAEKLENMLRKKESMIFWLG